MTEVEDVSKEVLAAVEEPRIELINTAVKFLTNPKVQQSTLAQRRAFLEKKGLTKDEIDLAVQRSGTSPEEKYPPQSHSNELSSNVLQPYKQPTSIYVKIRDILHTATMIGGLSYAVFKFFTEIVQPWIYGKPRTSERLDKIENMVMEINKSIAETLLKIQENLNSLQETVSSSQEKVQAISNELYSQRPSVALSSIGDSQFATEMKTELQTLKGLLLNRRQFPPTPSSAALLPSWQLEQTSAKTSDKSSTFEENSGDCELTDNSKEVKVELSPGDCELTDNSKEVKVELSPGDCELTDKSKEVKVELSPASSVQLEDDDKSTNDAKIIKNNENDTQNKHSDSELD